MMLINRMAERPAMTQDKRRSQWHGPVGLGLIVLFCLLRLPLLLFASIFEIGIGHGLFVLITTAGLCVSINGLRYGDLSNRLVSLFVLLFFVLVVVLLYLRGRA
jgi:hypothetical protein